MRLSVPGIPGVYYDTDGESTSVAVALTAAGKRAPKPHGYALQLLPHLWSFDVDLREVPTDHPIQYVHPEGARSVAELARDRELRDIGNELDHVARFVWAVNEEVESAAGQLAGRDEGEQGVVIEVQDGDLAVDGEELETDEFDIDDGDPGFDDGSSIGSEDSSRGFGEDTDGDLDDGGDPDDRLGDDPTDEFDDA